MTQSEDSLGFPASASLDELLQIASSKFPVHFEPITIQGTELQILQITDLEEYIDRLAEAAGPDQPLHLPFWARIWPTSILLSYYVQRLAPEPEAEMLEIGAGIGLCGLAAAAEGMRVCITDSETDALLFSRINILQNGLQDRAKVARADFTSTRLPRRFTYIVGSEVLYKEEHYSPMIDFFLEHLRPEPRSEIVLARDYRIGAKEFFRAARERFSIQEKCIGYTEKSEDGSQGDRHLCAISRLKPLESESGRTS